MNKACSMPPNITQEEYTSIYRADRHKCPNISFRTTTPMKNIALNHTVNSITRNSSMGNNMDNSKATSSSTLLDHIINKVMAILGANSSTSITASSNNITVNSRGITSRTRRLRRPSRSICQRFLESSREAAAQSCKNEHTRL